MAKAKYAFQGMEESMARAMKRDVEVSMKVAAEMCSFLKGRSTTQAKQILERVLKYTQAIPYKKHTDGVGHRKGAGIAAGRYPQKASTIFIELIESAEANAQAKGLSTELKIIHLAPQKPTGAFHYGRLRRRKFKRAHLEIVVKEVEKEAKVAKPKVAKIAKETKTEATKTEKVEKVAVEQSQEPKEAVKPKKKAAPKKSQEDKQ